MLAARTLALAFASVAQANDEQCARVLVIARKPGTVAPHVLLIAPQILTTFDITQAHQAICRYWFALSEGGLCSYDELSFVNNLLQL